MNVLGISFGRKMMNCDVMVKAALMECKAAGHEIRFIRADDLDIKPCTGCTSCVVGLCTGNGRGECHLKDDFHILDEALMESDAIIFGCPAFETLPTGRFKTVCDRLGPSHDISFRKTAYEDGLKAGKPEEKLPDKRSLKSRSGSLQAVPFMDLCYSGRWTRDEMYKRLTKTGGLVDHLGTSEMRDVSELAAKGIKRAQLIYSAFIYQLAKWIGAMAAVLDGRVERIILTGGIANDEGLCARLEEKVSFIAPVIRKPGEFELEALASGALRVLRGEEAPKTYTGEPVFTGFGF